MFIPASGVGHFQSTAEFAKCLLDRDDRLLVTILVIHRPGGAVPALEAKIQSLSATDTQIRCINIPPVEPPSSFKSPEKFYSDFIESHKPHVEHAIRTELLSDDSVQLPTQDPFLPLLHIWCSFSRPHAVPSSPPLPSWS